MTCVAQLPAPWREPAEVLSAFADEPWALGLVTGGAGARWSYVARAPSARRAVACTRFYAQGTGQAGLFPT